MLTSALPRAAPMSLSAFPSLDTFRADADRVAPVLYADAPLKRIIFVYFDDTQIPLSVNRTPPVREQATDADDMPPLSSKQRAILISLRDEGAATGETLAKRLGYAGPSSLHGKKAPSGKITGGVRELMEHGLVLNDEEEGYQLTGFGKDVAARLGDSE